MLTKIVYLSLILAEISLCQRSDYFVDITPQSQTNWGAWGAIEWCPVDHYAYAFMLVVEQYGTTDDTGLNVIKLFCKYVLCPNIQININTPFPDPVMA
jgi:hypothetical protein